MGTSAKERTMGQISKRRGQRGSSLLLEAAGLKWLADAEQDGGIRVAKVVSATDEELSEERITEATPSAEAARRIGTGLAHMHAAGAPWLGCPPEGWPPADGEPFPSESLGRGLWTGRARTPYASRKDAPATWGEFFAEYRIMYYVRILRDEGSFGREDATLLERVASRVFAGTFDAPEPALVEQAMKEDPATIACARLHGDLWGGNVLYCAGPTGGALIDPMAYGGHAETDLAMLALFGFPFLDEVLAGYDEASPLANGWRERMGLHQLAPLLLHCVLFGGAYIPETLRMARRYA